MLGSAKLSGMASHSAVYGDHFSLVKGAHPSLEKHAKSQYYPIALVNNEKKNSIHNKKFTTLIICLCGVRSTIGIPLKLLKWPQLAKTKQNYKEYWNFTFGYMCHKSSIPASKLLPSWSISFVLWELHGLHLGLWMKSQPTDLFYIPSDKLKRCGELVAQASLSTLPASFCGICSWPILEEYQPVQNLWMDGTTTLVLNFNSMNQCYPILHILFILWNLLWQSHPSLKMI